MRGAEEEVGGTFECSFGFADDDSRANVVHCVEGMMNVTITIFRFVSA